MIFCIFIGSHILCYFSYSSAVPDHAVTGESTIKWRANAAFYSAMKIGRWYGWYERTAVEVN